MVRSYVVTNPPREVAFVEINSHWRVGWNPYGAGLVLAVDRGINCEFHVQVVSAHTTNTPELEDVKKVVEGQLADLNAMINAFCDFMKAVRPITSDQSEAFAMIFYRHLLGKIAFLAEEAFNERRSSSPPSEQGA